MHWDYSTSSWSIVFRRLLKDIEILELQNLMTQLASKKVSNNPNRRIWSLEEHRKFTVKSLTRHLLAFSPLAKDLHKALCKPKCPPKRVSILVWIMIFGLLNCASVMQLKTPNSCLSPSMCPLCKQEGEDLQHLFFKCSLSKLLVEAFFIFDVVCVFGILLTKMFSKWVRYLRRN